MPSTRSPPYRPSCSLPRLEKNGQTLRSACLRVLASLAGASDTIIPDFSDAIAGYCSLKTLMNDPMPSIETLPSSMPCESLRRCCRHGVGCFARQNVRAYRCAPTLTDLQKKWSNLLGIPIWQQAPSLGHHADPLTIPIGRTISVSVSLCCVAFLSVDS